MHAVSIAIGCIFASHTLLPTVIMFLTNHGVVSTPTLFGMHCYFFKTKKKWSQTVSFHTHITHTHAHSRLFFDLFVLLFDRLCSDIVECWSDAAILCLLLSPVFREKSQCFPLCGWHSPLPTTTVLARRLALFFLFSSHIITCTTSTHNESHNKHQVWLLRLWSIIIVLL